MADPLHLTADAATAADTSGGVDPSPIGGNPVPATMQVPDGPGGAEASLARLSLDPNGKSPVVKNFTADWVRGLTERGTPKVYTAANSADFAYIGMPVGGLGAGQVYLSGDGKLWWWDIFATRASVWPNDQFNAYVSPYHVNDVKDSKQYVIAQGFGVRVHGSGGATTRTLDKTGFSDVKFLGQYPIGTVHYKDADFPVDVTLEAFSPFIPLDTADSTLPATIMRFTVTNTSHEPVEGDLTGWLENPVCIESGQKSSGRRMNTVRRQATLTALDYAPDQETFAAPAQPQDPIVYEDFKSGTYDAWTVEGTAFGTKPVKLGDIHHDQAIQGQLSGMMADSFLSSSDNATGKLTSKPFQISRAFINVHLGGGNHPGGTCVNLVVDGSVARSATGQDSETLTWTTWKVAGMAGKTAHLEIVDSETGGWGHIMVDEIEFSDVPRAVTGGESATHDAGTMTFAVVGDAAHITANPSVPLDQVMTAPPSASESESRDFDTCITEPLIGSLAHKFSLKPGQSATINYIVAWNFPGPENIGINADMRRNYANRFPTSGAVADYVASNLPRLTEQTMLWRKTWYDSTLPYWFLDRTFLNTSILATSTAHYLYDGRFYGYEGMYSCPGCCTHVWGYVQAMGRLFPDLDKSMLEHDHLMPGIGMNPDGGIGMRSEIDHTPASDGQSDVVLRSCLAHHYTADNAFLDRNYGAIKKAMEYLRTANDPAGSGTLIGSQHNTLDAEYHTRNAWLSLNYQAALRAMATLAVDQGDPAYARTLIEVADKGRDYVENHLFNGEYFYQEHDPNYPDSTGTFDACEYSQLVGDNWSHQIGVGPVVHPEKAITALNTLWRYNFTTDVADYTKKYGTGRPFVLPGEGGLVACTYPNGEDTHNVAYLNECQAGYEYACTSAMMWEGLVDKALAHLKTVHERYDGSKRNPWNEVEAGSHYSRSMTSYGLFTAMCGFEYHGPRGYIAFVPRLRPENFRAPFTGAEGWGTYAQTRTGQKQTHTIAMTYGKIHLKMLAFAVPADANPKSVRAMLGVTPVAATMTRDGQRVLVTLAHSAQIHAGQSLEVVIA